MIVQDRKKRMTVAMSWFVNFLAEKVGWHGGENHDEVYGKQKVNIKYPTQIFVKMHHTRTVRVLTLANTCTKLST